MVFKAYDEILIITLKIPDYIKVHILLVDDRIWIAVNQSV